jgi:hypothetical protein
MKKAMSMYMNAFMVLILGIIISAIIYVILGRFNIGIHNNSAAIFDFFK